MKSKILYAVTMILIATMLVVLTGCGKKEKKENNQTSVVEEKKEVNLINNQKNIVYTVKEESGYRIPKINLAYDNIKELNKEILAFGEEFIASITIDNKIETGGKLEYTYYENDNILSVVYEYETPFTVTSNAYKVWNVDKYTGEVITNEQILAKKGISAEEFQIKYTEQCKIKYEGMVANIKEEAEKSGNTELLDFYNKQYENTVSVENNNINNEMFLDKNNEINMIAKIYSLAAAEYYEQIIAVNK